MNTVSSPSGNTFAIITLGCKVNQYESHALRESWLAQGHTEVADPALAGLVCINSCAVTAKAVADVRAAVRRVHRTSPQARIVLTGCAAQVLQEELAALPGVSLVVPQQEKERLGAFPAFARPPAAVAAPPAFPPFSVSSYDRSRAMLKIQDGCSHRCTYCIVPLTRGPSRSRRREETLAEARRLLAAGFRELSVNGVNLSQYGRDLVAPHDFWDLLAFLEQELAPEWAGKARLRISSLEPGQLGAKALDILGKSRLIAPHLHLSLQSGSPEVLKRMGRGHYDPGMLHDFFQNLARIWPLFGLGADLLTAFPGETQAQFSETMTLCEALPFSYAHVFPYSRRPGTPAAEWPGQLPAEVKKHRAAALRRLIADKNTAFLQRSLALPQVQVVCEAAGTTGVNEFYTDCLFSVPPLSIAPRSLIPAKPVGVEKGKLVVLPLVP